MSSEWYYAHEGQSVGPVSLSELRRLADSGELQRTDLVWTAPMKEWEEAGGFDELFAPVVQAPPPSEPEVQASPPSRPVLEPPPSSDSGYASGQYQSSRPASSSGQHVGRGGGGHQGRGSRGGYYAAPRGQGVPPIVLVGFIITIAGILICAPISIIGTVLCMIGLGEAKRRQEGVGLAIAGIVIGLVMFVLGVIGFIFFFAMSGGNF